jgi:hypothetical protein
VRAAAPRLQRAGALSWSDAYTAAGAVTLTNTLAACKRDWAAELLDNTQLSLAELAAMDACSSDLKSVTDCMALPAAPPAADGSAPAAAAAAAQLPASSPAAGDAVSMSLPLMDILRVSCPAPGSVLASPLCSLAAEAPAPANATSGQQASCCAA